MRAEKIVEDVGSGVRAKNCGSFEFTSELLAFLMLMIQS